MTARRLVVTGQTAEGKSVFVSDGKVEAIAPALLAGWEFHRLWGSDETPALPTEGTPPSFPRYFPPSGRGYRFGFFTIPPDSTTIEENIDFTAALEHVSQVLPGLLDVLEPDNPGMHTTDTIDADVVISGEAWLELDDHEEVHLMPGDVVIQNGTRHRWRNRTDQPCVLFVVLLGAERAQT
jgi:mannose-6-phosphate isomerase-like protein (cupin superfamily)